MDLTQTLISSSRLLPAEMLRRRCDAASLEFESTAELLDGPSIVGQERALEALHFGVAIRHGGYNLYALGPTGTGKQFLARHAVERRALTMPVPDDICCVHNFDEPNKPRTLLLPAGTARRLKGDMAQLIEEIGIALPAAFETEDYQARLQAMKEAFKERPEAQLNALREQAKEKGFVMLTTPMGMVFAPVIEGEIVTPEAFEKLPEEQQQKLQESISALQEELQGLLRQMPSWERELREKIRELNQEISGFAIDHLFEELRGKYAQFEGVASYLTAVRSDVARRVREFIQAHEERSKSPVAQDMADSGLTRRYQVNVLVDHAESEHAPIVFEDHPTFENLVGRIEHFSHQGTLVTDFNLVRAGALHRANGGYLLLEARKLLQQPYAWEGLKRALKARRIRIESLGQVLSLVSTVSLEPEPVPLDTKVVLLGDRMLYYLLCAYDPEFEELFKVAADFDGVIERTPELERSYSRLIASLARQNQLIPFDRGAVASVIEHSSRLAGDALKLTAHTGEITDLLQEADFYAQQASREVVAPEDVQYAIEAQLRRADRVRERLQESILRGLVYIDTEGARVGQVNGLSVITLSNYAFGHPSRITARVRLGKGEVVDIEREVELGGPIHSKGILILTSFLGARYARDAPLSLHASLVFEQSYAGVEGDSASSAELYALLSAIADVPIRQSLAVTGSVNQHGEVQAIGGVNEKIEGFFDLCRARGFDGQQGVLIPEANVEHLMLRQEVVDAVAAGRFHIFRVASIDQGIELLTGMEAGAADTEGHFPYGTFNYRVARRLSELTETQLALSRAAQTE